MALDFGDIAWVITATALVMIMTPALGFFYGGLVPARVRFFLLRRLDVLGVGLRHVIVVWERNSTGE